MASINPFTHWITEHVQKDPLFTEHPIYGYDLHAAYPKPEKELSEEEKDLRFTAIENLRKLCDEKLREFNPDPEHIHITYSKSSPSATGPWPDAWSGIDLRVVNTKSEAEHTAAMTNLNNLIARVIAFVSQSPYWPTAEDFGVIIHGEVQGRTLNAKVERLYHFSPHICHLGGKEFRILDPWGEPGQGGLIDLQERLHALQKEDPTRTTKTLCEILEREGFRRIIEGIPYKEFTIDKYKYKD